MPTRLAVTALTVATVLAGAPAAVAVPAPTPGSSGPAAGVIPLPDAHEGWRVLPAVQGFDLVRLPVARTPVTDARPHIATAAGDLGPATVGRDGSLTVTVDRLPADLSTLVVRYGHATEAELLARKPQGDRGKAPDEGLAAPPGSPGVVTTTYTDAPMRLPGMPQPQAVTGRVVAPATGANLPVVLFLHGRHDWCYPETGWPCKAPSKAVPNLEGYRYLQEGLARRGYFTVSIDANAINAQDQFLADLGMSARSALVRTHLALLGTWRGGAGAPFAGAVKSRYDANRTMLVGHSRGGEGVAYAAVEQEPAKGYKVGGLVLVAPTNFFHSSASTTPTVTIAPGCDGDVSDLAGAGYADAADWYSPQHALSSLAYLPGANHNYFNTTWTPTQPTGSDDGSDTACSAKSRLAPARQRQAGLSIVTTAADRFLKGKGDPSAVDGTGVLPADQRWMGLVTSGTGGARRRLTDPATGGWTTTGATVCRGTSCAPRDQYGIARGVHWRGFPQEDPAGWRWDLGRSAAVLLRPATPVSLKGSTYVDVRVAVAPKASVTPTLRLTDAARRTVVLKPLGAATRVGIGGPTDGLGGRWVAQNVRFAIPAKGIDVTRITAVSLERGKATGTAVVLDLSAATAGTAPAAMVQPSVVRLPAAVTVKEGSKPWTYTVHAPLSPRPAQAVSGLTMVSAGGETALRPLAVKAGASEIPLQMTIPGNTVWNAGAWLVGQLRVRGPVLVANPTTAVSVTEDDPQPVVTVQPTAAGKPGGALTWTVTLDRPSGEAVGVEVIATKVAGGLGVADVAPAARQDWGITTSKDVPLDQAGARSFVLIAPGTRTGKVTLPLAPGARVGRVVALTPQVEGARLTVTTRLTGKVTR